MQATELIMMEAFGANVSIVVTLAKVFAILQFTLGIITKLYGIVKIRCQFRRDDDGNSGFRWE